MSGTGLRPIGLSPTGASLSQPSAALTAIAGVATVGAGQHRLTFWSPLVARDATPGQFVLLTPSHDPSASPVLPRPMAIYSTDPAAGTFDVVYRVVGAGTQRLAAARAGEELMVVGPLGRGFSISADARRMVMLGRGIGSCSLTMLADVGVRRGMLVDVVVSARTPPDLVGVHSYRRAGVRTVLSVHDSDGSSDPTRIRDHLDTLSSEGPVAFYVCGSRRLLDLAVRMARSPHDEVQVSLEAHMACGLGYCHACAAGEPGTAAESELICRDGPAFRVDHTVMGARA